MHKDQCPQMDVRVGLKPVENVCFASGFNPPATAHIDILNFDLLSLVQLSRPPVWAHYGAQT